MARSFLPLADYTVLITDETLQIVGDPILCWETIDATIKFNEPGAGIVTCPAHQWIVDMLQPGNRVVVIRQLGWQFGLPAQVLISGPIEVWLREQSDNGENAGVGKLTINFADDLARIMARQVYPNPALTPAAQTTDAWTFTGNAELALRSLVNGQAGPGALAPRRVPQLALGALASVGTSVSISTDRMDVIGEVMRQIATVGGNLGFQTQQVGNQILFQVYARPDLSNTIRFGFNLGNMQYRAYQVDAPTATTAIVGGQGNGADRALIERNNSADETAWGRVETLVSRPGTSPIQSLQDDGDSALADGAAKTRLSYNVSDSPNQRYGVDYNVGSIVSVETGTGTDMVDTVVTVHVQAYATAGEVVSTSVGSQAAQTAPAWVKIMQNIDSRLKTVERRIVASTP